MISGNSSEKSKGFQERVKKRVNEFGKEFKNEAFY